MVDFTSIWPDWGSTGDKPTDGKNYGAGDNPKANHFDYLWFYIRDTFSDVETEVDQNRTDINNLDSGKAADPHDNTAHSTDYAEDPHGSNAHDSTVVHDGDTVTSLTISDTLNAPVKSSDPTSPSEGQVWIRDDL